MENHYGDKGFKPANSYLFVMVMMASALFYLSYRYIHHLNQQPAVPLPISKPMAAPTPSSKTYSPEDRLLQIKLSRDRARSRDVERIQGMMIQAELSDTIRNEAEEELWRLTQATSKENELEQLLKTNGFQECLVTVGQRSVTVVIAGRLEPEAARVIGEFTAEVTGFNPSQIRIVEQ